MCQNFQKRTKNVCWGSLSAARPRSVALCFATTRSVRCNEAACFSCTFPVKEVGAADGCNLHLLHVRTSGPQGVGRPHASNDIVHRRLEWRAARFQGSAHCSSHRIAEAHGYARDTALFLRPAIARPQMYQKNVRTWTEAT